MKPCHDNNGAVNICSVEVSRPYTILCQRSLYKKVSIVSCSNTFQNLLWFVHGRGQKC